jgi:hypothetical protein
VVYNWEVPVVALGGWVLARDSWHPSYICSQRFGDNGECNGRIRHIMCKVVGSKIVISPFVWLAIVISPLRVCIGLALVSPSLGILLWGIPTLSLVLILSLLPVIVGLLRWVGRIQLFKGLNLLEMGRLNEVDPCLVLFVWGYNR